MILDQLDNAMTYASVHPLFVAALGFLRRPDLAQLPDARYEIAGDRLFALMSRGHGRGKDASPLEAHRRYVDVQVVLAGQEIIGYSPLAQCQSGGKGYDPRKDIEFYATPAGQWMHVPPGAFAVYFPCDAHAPLAGEGPVHKVVIKLAV